MIVSKRGFTLIELSIVLVIIGLIVGGILVGRDLIKAAEIRATITQTEQLDAAVNTFQGKYNCLPGDCKNATNFGFSSACIDASSGVTSDNGNGDGMIDNGWTPPSLEYAVAVDQLQQAHLFNVAGAIDSGNFNGNANCSVPFITLKMPASDVNGIHGNWLVQYIDTSVDALGLVTNVGHYYWATAMTNGQVGVVSNGNTSVFAPLDAFAIDTKLDDGQPLTGKVLASGVMYADTDVTGRLIPWFDATSDVGSTSSDNYCVIGTGGTTNPPYLYNVKNTNLQGTNGGLDGTLCTLVVKAAF